MEPTAQRHRVLIVDDEPDLLEVLAFELDRGGFDVLQAGSGHAAMGLLARERVDAVLTDLRMPGGDGIELLDRLKARDAETPVVMLVTGNPDLPLEEAFNKGAAAVFTKPYDGAKICAALRRELTPREQRWKTDNERHAVRLTIEFHAAGSGTKLAETANIGRGGMCVVAGTKAPAPGTLVGFKVHIDGGDPAAFEGYGRVRWAKTGNRPIFGVEFVHLGAGGAEVVEKTVTRDGVKAFIPKE